MTRPRHVVIASVLIAAYSLYALIWLFIPILSNDRSSIESSGFSSISLLVMIFSITLVSAYGVWQNQKWGKIIGIIVLTINALLALPGILFASTFIDRLQPLLGVVVAIAVIVLILRRANPVKPA